MTGQCSELILLIWSVWSGYRAIRVLYLSSSPIPSSLSQYSVSPSLSLTINNITTSDNHTASYRTTHTHLSSATNPTGSYLLQPLHTSQSPSIARDNGWFQTFIYSVILQRYQKYRPGQKTKQFSGIWNVYCNAKSNLRLLSFCISISEKCVDIIFIIHELVNICF